MNASYQGPPLKLSSEGATSTIRQLSDMSSDDVWRTAPGEQAQPDLPSFAGRPAASRPPLCPPQQSANDGLMNERYRVLRDLARGESGQVLHAIDLRTSQEVAIKLIDRTRKLFDTKIVDRELQNQLLCAAHPNIVQLREVFLTGQHLAIVMEYANGGDLAHYVDALVRHTGGGIPEAQARVLFQQLMVAVDFCHRLGIANRDIKLDNMMLNGGCDLKMCDFGFSKDVVGQSTCKSSCGTPEYIAPELLFQGKYNGQSADIWSCGVSLYVLLSGRFPFSWPVDVDPSAGQVKRMQKMFGRITTGAYLPVPEVSLECQDLIARMLQPVATSRATAAEVMQHPWFVSGLPRALMGVNEQLLERRRSGAPPPSSPSAQRLMCRQSSAELRHLVSGCKLVQDPQPALKPMRPRGAFGSAARHA